VAVSDLATAISHGQEIDALLNRGVIDDSIFLFTPWNINNRRVSSLETPMKLLAKFTFLFIFVFGSGQALAGFFVYRFLEANARDEVIQQARLMLQSALSMRHYTETEITPLLDTPQMVQTRFLPQTIPFYAATESFNAFRHYYPDYAYKEAALNPTNPRDRAVDWESDVITQFRNKPSLKELIGERSTPVGSSLFLGRPIVAQQECLACHSTPDQAPASMIKIYGTSNGFGWQNHDVIGAQIVSVPTSVAEAAAMTAFRSLMICMGSLSALTLLLLNLALYVTVIRPVSRLSKVADEISHGNLEIQMPGTKGSDEIAMLGQSFNRMYVSLTKAMRLLED
jgi:HAMP domain-containing protein